MSEVIKLRNVPLNCNLQYSPGNSIETHAQISTEEEFYMIFVFIFVHNSTVSKNVEVEDV